MVSAQQEASSLFLKSDTDRKATPSEHPVHCTVSVSPDGLSKSAVAQFQCVSLLIRALKQDDFLKHCMVAR